ncbi:replication endonuclease [Chitinimonas sp. PSY-7]|uniref:replication endonuclease n=1 Tax=Chitinimonas sp. PSY-7 TaxID=3459088 RepID=UPI00403FDBFC
MSDLSFLDEYSLCPPSAGPGQTDAEWLAENCPEHLAASKGYDGEPSTVAEFVRRHIPPQEWDDLKGADDKALLARFRYWQDQPAGFVDALQLQHKVDALIGDEDAALIDVARAGEEGASIASKLMDWLDIESVRDFLVERFGLRLPEPVEPEMVKPGSVTVEGVGRRLEDDRVWRRNLIRRHTQALEHSRIAEGRVRRGHETIISDQALRTMQSKWEDQQAALQATLAFSDAGDEVSLFDLQQASVSNPRLRFAELITRVKGFELIAEDIGHCAVFVTLTCPSCYHPSKTLSIKREKGKRAYKQVINPAWEAAGRPTPKHANNHLCRVWAQTRAAGARRGLAVYGIRVTEPHADACPHWHMILFGEPHALGQFVALFNYYACRDDAAELTEAVWEKVKVEGKPRPVWRKKSGATVRFDCMTMTPARVLEDGRRVGGAVAYITKYLTKNLDGKTEELAASGEHKALGDDFEAGTDTVTGAQKVRAWASLWRIRQFQLYGGPPVGLWRELRKLKGAEQDSVYLDYAVLAADKGDWRSFCQLMGGPIVARKAMPVELVKADRPDQLNRYGEPACAVVKGVQDVRQAQAEQVVTRTKVWRIEWRAEARATRSGVARPSRPCANNCTEPVDHIVLPVADSGLRAGYSDDPGPPPWELPPKPVYSPPDSHNYARLYG